jgi:hypothetical protein
LPSLANDVPSFLDTSAQDFGTMRATNGWWRRTLMSGSSASVLSAAAAYELARRRHGAPFAALNAVSHWLYGPVAYAADRPSLRHTLPGVAIHHASSLLWGALYQVLLRSVVDPRAIEGERVQRGHAGVADRCAAAAVVTAIGAFTDLRLVPRRLSPGFEHRLSKADVALVYASFAVGLALVGAGFSGRHVRPN